MGPYDVHVCLVSEHLVPNIIFIMHKPTRPTHVVLIVTPQMVGKADHLTRIINREGVSVENVVVDAYDYENVWLQVAEFVESHAAHSIALNITGGTKLMSLAVFDVFREKDLPIFYVDTFNQKIRHLGRHQHDEDLPNILKSSALLQAYEYGVIKKGAVDLPKKWGDVAFELRRNNHRWERHVRKLNGIVAEMRKSKVLNVDAERVALMNDFMSLLAEHELVTRYADRVEFVNEKALEFINGGWLEDEVYRIVAGLRPKLSIRDLSKNVEIRRANVPNELDVIFTANNQLHIIECKTKSFDHGEDASASVYKLSALRDDLGGSFVKAMLVSYRQLPVHMINRCRTNKIEFIDKSGLSNIEERISRWVKGNGK